MRNDIITFAQTLFPGQDTLTALELLLLAVYATIDDICFAAQDAEDPLLLNSPEDTEDYYWDYCF